MLQLDLVKTLMKYGADANIRDGMGHTPLFAATGRYPNVEIATYLIEEANASVNIRSVTNATVLHCASFDGNVGKYTLNI